MELIRIDHDLDEIISLMGLNFLPPMARRAVTMSTSATVSGRFCDGFETASAEKSK